MSKITTYACDRCQTIVAAQDSLYRVGVMCYHQSSYAQPVQTVEGTADWCRPCCDALQLTGYRKPAPGKQGPQELTLEEKIREIMREEIQNATGAC